MAGLLSTRPSAPWLHCRVVAAAAAVLGLLACGALLAPDSAPAQELQFPKRPPPAKKSKVALEREKSGQKQMLVRRPRSITTTPTIALPPLATFRSITATRPSRPIVSSTIKRPNAFTLKGTSG
jgi:hypothetical protein